MYALLSVVAQENIFNFDEELTADNFFERADRYVLISTIATIVGTVSVPLILICIVVGGHAFTIILILVLGGMGFVVAFSTIGVHFAMTKYKRKLKDDERLLFSDEEEILQRSLTSMARSTDLSDGKFQGRTLVLGQPAEAALGVAVVVGMEQRTEELNLRLSRGMQAIIDEVTEHGTEDDRECLQYILNEEAGSNKTVYPNSEFPRDCDENGVCASRKTMRGAGMRFVDFVNHENSQTARLTEANVLALRLYTTWAFRSINTPLRDTQRTEAHPLAATVAFLSEGIKKLRARGAYTRNAQREVTLWRGMKNLQVDGEFLRVGGSERAPMSTTTDPVVAAAYSVSEHALLFKIKTTGFLERGVDLTYLSAYPHEAEYLYPPLTFLKPTGRMQTVQTDQGKFEVVEVEPTVGG